MMQTLFGLGSADVPYVVFTDNIYSLTARFYPEWAPLGRAAGAQRVRLERNVCRDARFVFATSNFLRNGLLGDYGCDPERVVTIPAPRQRARPTHPTVHGRRCPRHSS